MGEEKCMITYPVGGHKETAVKSAIMMGAKKIILMHDDESYTDLFSKFGFSSNIKPILTKDTRLIASYVADLISETKKDCLDVSVLLLPADIAITIGIYVAACMEKVKVLTPISQPEIKNFNLPLFPFVNLNENERFIIAKIIENKELSTKNLLSLIKKRGCYNSLCSKYSDPEIKEMSALRQLQRILGNLEKMGLIGKEKRSRYFIWSAKPEGKSMLMQEE